MTRRQANLISDMIRSQTTAAFHDARRELLESCEEQKSDAAALQPSVTVTATSSQSEPVQPSTPQPVGFDYKRSLLEGEKKTTLSMYMGAVENANKLQAEVKSLKEVIGSQDGKIASLKESVENRTKTIEMLKNQIELLTKRIKEDREHQDDCREHNNELVAANAEIYTSLRRWGLEQTEPCSLVNNVKQVIQLCAERGKKIADLQKVIDLLSKQQSSGDRGTLRAIISQLKLENELLCERIKHRLDESKALSASIHKSREQIEALKETVNGHADVIAEKNKAISLLNDRITRSSEAMTMLGVDNKKLNEALEALTSENQKLADNIAKLRHEKASDEASYIKKLTDKALRIAILKQVGNDLCKVIKLRLWRFVDQEELIAAIRNWEKEAR